MARAEAVANTVRRVSIGVFLIVGPKCVLMRADHFVQAVGLPAARASGGHGVPHFLLDRVQKPGYEVPGDIPGNEDNPGCLVAAWPAVQELRRADDMADAVDDSRL